MTSVENTPHLRSSEPSATEAIDFQKSRAMRKTQEKLISWTNDQFSMIKNARSSVERQWYLNLAFFFGKQYVVAKSTRVGGVQTTKLFTPPAPWWRVRPVINRIMPTILKDLATLTGNKPTAIVVPASAEETDMYAAMAGEQIWQSQYDTKKLKATFRRAMWWTLNCGTGYVKTVWNEAKQDITYAHETPFHVYVPDFRAEDVEDQPFLIHAQLRSEEYVKANFKDMVHPGGNLSNAKEILDPSFLNILDADQLERQHNTLVLEVWVKPGLMSDFPSGLFMTIVGSTIVQAGEGWPFQHGEFPFAKFDYIPSGKYYGMSLTETLIPLQKEYNRTRGQIIESKNLMAKPKLLYPRGSIDMSKITTEPGQGIPYTPGFEKPTPLPMQDLPAYVLQELDRILIDWQDIAGQHEVSKGQVPTGVTAATAISFLQERDESQLSATFDSMEDGIGKVARHTLSHANEFWDQPRLVKITGTDGSFDAMSFSGADLKDNTDIRIENGSALPQSKAAKQALILDLMKMGFVKPDKGLEVMDIGGINKIYDQVQVDKRAAQRENLRMSKMTEELYQQFLEQNPPEVDPMTGQPGPPPLPVKVNTWDNHELHVEVHNNFRKGQTFETLPDFIRAMFEQHVQDHIKALGIEQVTNNPLLAAGIPPGILSMTQPPGAEGQPPGPAGPPQGPPEQQEQLPPGPEPMPEGVM